MNARIPPTALDTTQALAQVSQQWDRDIVTQLKDYIAIPAKSPMFAPDWAAQGLLDTVLRNAATWVDAQKVAGLKLEIVRLEGRTPVLFFEVEGTQPGANAPGAFACVVGVPQGAVGIAPAPWRPGPACVGMAFLQCPPTGARHECPRTPHRP